MTHIYDKVIVGGGVAGLWAAYEILSMAKEAGKIIPNVALIAEKFNASTHAGTNIVFGLDGYEDDPERTGADQIHGLIRKAMSRADQIIQNEEIPCRKKNGYQFLADSDEGVQGIMEFALSFGYTRDEFVTLEDTDRVTFEGFDRGLFSNAIGQINVPELEQGLVRAIKKWGGKIYENYSYRDHEIGEDGIIRVNTKRTSFLSKNPPLLATGAHHFISLGLPVKAIYTGAMHVQLTPEHAKALSPSGNPVAFCDTRLDGDVFWGSLDEKNVLTIGFGDTQNPADKLKLIADLKRRFGEILPDLATQYLDKATFSFGAMGTAENSFPLVGRLPDYDVSGGWASRGVIQSLAAATAYAKWVVLGDDSDLKKFEHLNVTDIQALWANRPSTVRCQVFGGGKGPTITA